MSSRHSDFHTRSFARLSPATFNQSPLNDPTRLETRFSTRNSPPPQSDSSNSPATLPRCITPPHSISLLERHAISNYPTKKTQLPLSVYELPTATYMWPRWDPQRGEPPSQDPVIYVKYRPPQSDSDAFSAHSRPPSRESRLTVSSESHPSPFSTPPPPSYSYKRGSSAESNELPTSPSDRFLKLPRDSHNNAPSRVTSVHSATPNIPSDHSTHPTQRTDRDMTIMHHSIPSAESDSSDIELLPAGYLYSAHQANSSRTSTLLARSMAPESRVPALVPFRVDRDDDPSKDEWMKYTFPPPETSAGPNFECTWQIAQASGTGRPCGYSSKKHLVKRHIESKHLQLRPCKCHFCGKGFSQKSNLDTHLNTHTGQAPHKCHYCDEFFKDPARRHRHMIQIHQHRSSRTKKGRVLGTGSSAEGSDIGDVEEFTTPPPA